MSEDSPLTVIIPTWNQSGLLRACLVSLRHQTSPCRVLVVDNGSSDDTLEMIDRDFPWVSRLNLGQNLGFARAVNAGIGRAETPYVALLNNDTETHPAWVEAGLRGLRDYPEFWCFASRMVRLQDRTWLDGAGDWYNRFGLAGKRGAGQPADQYDQDEPVLAVSAGAAFYRKELFERIGLFDETYHMYLEDVDLSLRAQLQGLPCLYLAEAVVYHLEAASDPDLVGRARQVRVRSGALVVYSPSRVFWITRNRWLLMLTYQPWRHAPWLAVGWLRSFLFHAVRAGFTAAFLRGIMAGVRLTPWALSKRRELLRRSRYRSMKEPWSHWSGF